MEWLRERVRAIPVRLAFESALELMGTTQIGSFQVCGRLSNGHSSGIALARKAHLVCAELMSSQTRPEGRLPCLGRGDW